MTDETNQVNPENVAQPEETQAQAESTPASEVKAPDDAGIDLTTVQKRIDRLTWERHEAERRAQRAEELLQQSLTKREPEQPQALKPPTLAQFEYDEAKYLEAVERYTDAKLDEKLSSRQKQQEQQSSQESTAKRFREKEAEFEKSNPQYRQKVYGDDFMRVPLSGETALLIAESDLAPEIALHLAENIPLAQQIARLSPVQAAREIGRIEAKLANKPAPAPVTKAPPPPPKMEEGSDPVIKVKVDDAESDNLSDAEWMRRRNLQIQKRK